MHLKRLLSVLIPNTVEERLSNIERELQAIKERNRKVEADKAWEMSLFRMSSLAFIIYVVAALLLYFIDVPHFLLSALVPAAGFMLSVQTLPALKRWWTRRFLKN